MAEEQLEQLFRSCDPLGLGYITPCQFRELCQKFDIISSDADAIFQDLDHDCDGRISMEDFAWGFRNFCIESAGMNLNSEEDKKGYQEFAGFCYRKKKKKNNERKFSQAMMAWSHLAAGLGDSKQFLTSSSLTLAELYMELQANQESSRLTNHFKSALKSLLQDVEKLYEENKKMETLFAREKESHTMHLKHLEEELDSQVAKIEAKVREETQTKFSLEKEALEKRIAAQTEELYDHFKLFHQANAFFKTAQVENCISNEFHEKIETENRELRQKLAEARTNFNLLQSEMMHLRLNYIKKLNPSFSPTTSRTSSVFGSISDEGPNSLGEGLIVHDNENPLVGAQNITEETDSGRSTMQFEFDKESNLSLQEIPLNTKNGAYDSLHDDFKSFSENADENDEFRSYEVEYGHASDSQIHRTFKIVFAGDAAVGKSCFIIRLCKGIYTGNLSSTLGVDYKIKSLKVDGKTFALQLWDTAGQERFRCLTKTYFRKADGVMLLYDVTNERSFLNVRQWMGNIKESCEKKLPIIICANKIDILNKETVKTLPCVSRKHGEQLAKNYGALYFETSSKSNINLIESTIAICREMLLQEDVEIKSSTLQINNKNDKSKSHSCCGRK